MSDDLLQVELVAADRLVWSGQAAMVLTRTTEGDIGILPNHAPVLSLMVDGIVEVELPDGERLVAAVDAGLISMARNHISILSEHAELSDEIDLDRARSELENVQSGADETDAETDAAVRRAEARVRAAERAS